MCFFLISVFITDEIEGKTENQKELFSVSCDYGIQGPLCKKKKNIFFRKAISILAISFFVFVSDFGFHSFE